MSNVAFWQPSPAARQRLSAELVAFHAPGVKLRAHPGFQKLTSLGTVRYALRSTGT